MSIPPFQINSTILKHSQCIGYELGVLAGAKLYSVPVKLRKNNKIRTIHSSLAIEGNSLTIDQVTDILYGKKIIASEKDITEVKNAIKVYDQLTAWNPLSLESFKESHAMLMQGLINSNGSWREKGVGIYKGEKLAHMALPASRVNIFMQNLFEFIKSSKDISWLLKACIFHYELEFIHPFEDGNGRMGRLWQQLLLMQESPVFEFISTESIIQRNQQEYYDVLAQCDQQGESTEFIKFSLEKILLILKEYTSTATSSTMQSEQRLEYAKNILSNWFTRKEYMSIHKDISSATASRDLADAVSYGALAKRGENNQVVYRFKSL
jgi:Fic family protein